ncbi:MAG: hypothetical protein A3C11_02390 [Candidatus Sungbacteria bacterium RIFCSPHIGHO2_02_FULL_49_12]|uniref:Homing endonuclease LAGLIDADG domain-containing protein n=1 Tax=Candidatus Sungbacteria bacterium RIFCSPHIGHO2_02_FULL_49_12 TaxID=1802271 RepID=A0A1G2KSY4_9BACT|nr:MAG: hypothetical protein A3C11_02390 [Candidatus Sungbacteria bacterium RIFCSPHIGHO2_02_FULL_49_12]
MNEIGVKHENLSIDFIAGLIVGEGTFYWTKTKDGYKLPGFGLKMHIRDYDLVTDVRDSLGLTNEKVYEYRHDNRHFAFLIVRSVPSLKNVIIPLLWPRLSGYKKRQFTAWFRRFDEDDTHPGYRFFFHAFKQKFPELYPK